MTDNKNQKRLPQTGPTAPVPYLARLLQYRKLTRVYQGLPLQRTFIVKGETLRAHEKMAQEDKMGAHMCCNEHTPQKIFTLTIIERTFIM